jgi:hypothetical protein
VLSAEPRFLARFQEYQEAFDALKTQLTKLANEQASQDSIDCKGLEGEERMEFLFKTLAFYKCVDCKLPYCGGLVSCAAEMEIDVEQLRCQSCSFNKLAPVPAPAPEQKEAPVSNMKLFPDGSPNMRCLDHGYKYAVFKCDSCCKMATYDCMWNHYCDRCHDIASQPKDFPCPGEKDCPLGIKHPPNLPAPYNGKEHSPVPFVLGCLKCIGIDQVTQQYAGNPHTF